MARTANVFARVEPEVKEQAEQVLDRLGIPMSNAVGMFLRQIVLQRGIPFEMKLPAYELRRDAACPAIRQTSRSAICRELSTPPCFSGLSVSERREHRTTASS